MDIAQLSADESDDQMLQFQMQQQAVEFGQQNPISEQQQ